MTSKKSRPKWGPRGRRRRTSHQMAVLWAERLIAEAKMTCEPVAIIWGLAGMRDAVGNTLRARGYKTEVVNADTLTVGLNTSKELQHVHTSK